MTLLSKFTKRERIIFILTISLISSLIVYVFVLEPVYKKWSQLRLEYESAGLRLVRNEKLLANKKNIEGEYEKYKEYIRKKEDKEQEMASILKEIEATASGSGVKITSIKPKGEKQLKNYKEYSVELVSEATLNQFIKFIYDLESSKELLKVERLVLSLKSAQSDLLKGTLIVRKISF